MTAIAPRMPMRLGNLSGIQKAAILCMALGVEASARIMMRLNPDEVEAISRVITRTPAVPSEQVDAVLGEFQDVARAVAAMAEGGEEYAREMLEKAVGSQRTRTLLDRIRDVGPPPETSKLNQAGPDALQMALRGENPQTLALVLAHLEPKIAAQMIAGMDAERSADVLYRVARMEKVAPEVLQLVETAIVRQSQQATGQEMTASGGPAVAAQMLNQLPLGADAPLLDGVGVREPEVAEAIRSFMFVFEDLCKLDDKATQRLLRDVESRELAVALKAASDELKTHIMKNMSERGSAALREEMEMLGPVKVKDVEAAHTNIIATVRSLQAAGEITIERGGEDDVIT